MQSMAQFPFPDDILKLRVKKKERALPGALFFLFGFFGAAYAEIKFGDRRGLVCAAPEDQ
ncbi:MAG TPA: hypothetical protein VIL63_03210 [Terriglobales bacterium]